MRRESGGRGGGGSSARAHRGRCCAVSTSSPSPSPPRPPPPPPPPPPPHTHTHTHPPPPPHTHTPLPPHHSPSSYYLSKAALDGLLLRVAPALLFAASFYPLSGFRRDVPAAALFVGVLAAFAATVGALSLACAAGAGSAGRAALAMNLILLFSLALAGFLVNAEAIPASLRWLRQLSTFRYAFEALATSELSGLTLTIEPPGVGSQPGVGGAKGGGGRRRASPWAAPRSVGPGGWTSRSSWRAKLS